MISRKASLFAMAAVLVAGYAIAQNQSSSSTSTSKQGGATATASSSSRSSSSGSQNAGSSGGGLMMSTAKPTHVILYSAGPNWIEGKPAVEQNLRPHADYMAGMTKKGILIFGGPWRDEPGGLAVLRCRDDAEAEEVFRNDPAVKMGVMAGQLKAWTVYFQGTGMPAMPNLPGLGGRPPAPK